MQRLLCYLIAFSLSWTTVGYACDMDGDILRPACCCDGTAQTPCRTTGHDCAQAISGAHGDGCCVLVTTPPSSAQGETQASTHVPALLIDVAATRVLPINPDIPVPPLKSIRCPAAPSVYLLTGRLRR